MTADVQPVPVIIPAWARGQIVIRQAQTHPDLEDWLRVAWAVARGGRVRFRLV